MSKSEEHTSDQAKDGLKKGPWSAEEDQKLIDYINKNGYGRWRTLPENAGLRRCGKSCRLRWTNYLRPDIKRGSFTAEEEDIIIHMHSILGNKWSSIATCLPQRTDNEIKNYWNTHIKKRLSRMGIDPVTHAPCVRPLDLSPLVRMLGSTTTADINLSDFATHLFPRKKMEEVVSPQNPQQTPLLNCSDEFQRHIQSLLSGHQNLSPNPNPFTSSLDCEIPNSWHSETPISNSGDYVTSHSTYEVSTSLPRAVNSGSMMRYRGGCTIGNEEEMNSYGFIFDMENDSYVNSIM